MNQCLRLFASIMTLLSLIACQHTTGEGQNTLRGYAASYCLSIAYPNTVIANDAQAAAGAYLEMGTHAIEDYEHIREQVMQWRATPYSSKQNNNLAVMQCLDFALNHVKD